MAYEKQNKTKNKKKVDFLATVALNDAHQTDTKDEKWL